MSRITVRLGLALALLVGLSLSPPLRAAADSVTFTVAVPSAFARTQPGTASSPAFSVFRGQTYAVIGRTADFAWLQVRAASAPAGSAWVLAAHGQVSGALEFVAVTAAAAPGPDSGAVPAEFTVTVASVYVRRAPETGAAPLFSLFKGQTARVVGRSADGVWVQVKYGASGPGWLAVTNGSLGPAAPGATSPQEPAGSPAYLDFTPPTASRTARQIYQRGLASGNNSRAFSKVGDCLSVLPYFLGAFDGSRYRLGEYAYLQETVSHFAGSFRRESLAARDGLNVSSVLDPMWADPAVCKPNESPLACEYRLHRPSLAVISLGTNGEWLSDEAYEADLRRVLDVSIERGVLPILSTKADNLEGGDRFNAIVVRLAAEYRLPLWDFASVARSLPDSGMVAGGGYRLTYGLSYFDQPRNLSLGWPIRNLTALQTLDAVWRTAR
jgi:hypothetical protein